MNQPEDRDSSREKIKAFYDAAVEREWGRLDRHRTEFAVTMRAIENGLRFLATPPRSPATPPRPLRVIDIGGGPGRYSQALHEAGHSVTLLDLSPANVERAREVTGGALAGYHQGTATDLGVFADASFDAALLLGPLYHLVDEADRRRAVAEACRVLVPGGLLFAAFITVYAPIRDLAKFAPEELPLQMPTPEKVVGWLRDGRNPWGGEGGFTDAWFVHPADVIPFMESAADLETLTLLAAEGVVSMIEDKVNDLDGPLWDYWAELNYRLASDPSLHGGAEHLLYVGRKMGYR